MSLFGRRKPGFSKEVELKPSEIPGEFSDALDPALNKMDNPKAEKIEMQQRAAAVMAGAQEAADAADAQAAPQGKIDLFDYMESLPDVEDPFPPMEPDEPVEAPAKTPAELLADFIRERTLAAQLTPLAMIKKEEESWEELMAQIKETPSCADIVSVQGEKDAYYYSNATMADNYAMIAAFIEDKDVPRTIAEMVRFNCKIYPAPTPLYHFMRHPYAYTKPQIERARDEIKRRKGYEDIEDLTAFNGIVYLFSTQTMSRRYAQALADSAEHTEGDE